MNCTPALERRPAQTPSLEDIWRALANDQLLPWFQAIVELPSRRVIAAEALARWRHPALGILPPASFVPALEARGMLRQLTELMLEKSLYSCLDWRRQGFDLPVSVNLGAESLLDPELPSRLLQQLRILNLPASCLILEFNSRMLRSHQAAAGFMLPALHAAGFGVAADDFSPDDGWLPPAASVLKLARGCAQNLASHHQPRAALSAILSQARRRNAAVVAIGVENESECAALAALGCNAAQGYLFAPPMSPSEFSEWISSG
ncbi:EAL domain-containing protein [Chromobacterium sinusclupearum]|uniref:EAL domain-containing protein n=1 Tax=Chromobacterium sinusclupearum TaxID=2077146 RepID=A0A2K4ML95_9NEIS|nr:EAL domain-containing protein [Chromobacterium sinusclupearum]POA97828.1 EAL domain-containing protein [Chromobacterium sinusclupearum]